eukprot:gene7673-8978_t
MTIRVGINGFGRMGRLSLRVAMARQEIQVVHVNEIKGGVETAAHLFNYDSVQGKYKGGVKVVDGAMCIDGKTITFSEHHTPADIPWSKYGVDLVIECTGKFLTCQVLATHRVAKVIVSAPVKEDGALNVVMGVNDHLYEPSKHDIITAASCTTNCLAPVVKVIHENLARSCLTSLVPTSTGSATAIALIYPDLKGKLNGHAIRVPLLNASLTDCVFEVNRPTSVQEVNQLLKEASITGSLVNILGYEELPLVSVDYRGDPRSSIIDALSTLVTNSTQVKIFAWYDNEWGYVNRMVDLTVKVALLLPK